MGLPKVNSAAMVRMAGVITSRSQTHHLVLTTQMHLDNILSQDKNKINQWLHVESDSMKM